MGKIHLDQVSIPLEDKFHLLNILDANCLLYFQSFCHSFYLLEHLVASESESSNNLVANYLLA
jgi:hypothetical protein